MPVIASSFFGQKFDIGECCLQFIIKLGLFFDRNVGRVVRMAPLRTALVYDCYLCLSLENRYYLFAGRGYGLLGGVFVVELMGLLDNLEVFGIELCSELIFPVVFPDEPGLVFGEVQNHF